MYEQNTKSYAGETLIGWWDMYPVPQCIEYPRLRNPLKVTSPDADDMKRYLRDALARGAVGITLHGLFDKTSQRIKYAGIV